MATLRVTRLHTVDGRTRFSDIDLPAELMTELPDGVDGHGGGIEIVEFAAARTIFTFTPAGFSLAHRARARHLGVMLEGTLAVDCAAGTRHFEAGSILLGDDLTGEGHTSRALTALRMLLIYSPAIDAIDWDSR